MKCRLAFVFLLILLVPAVSFGSAVQAGFPTQAIWASKSSVVEGETVLVSAVILNSGSETLRATLVFTAEGTHIGAREFELLSGESQIHSIEWKPKKGEYKVAAKIEGTSAALSQKETPPITVTVAEPPPPSVAQQTVSQIVQTAGTIASSSLPTVLGVATSIFDAIEPLRKEGVERLENYLTARGTIAGTSTSASESNMTGFGTPATKNKSILSNIAQIAAAAALFTMKNIALFYPLLALLILGALYVLARRVRRPRK